MSDYLTQRLDLYSSLVLARDKKKVTYKHVSTPFLGEDKSTSNSPAAAPAPGRKYKKHTCPWCNNLFEPCGRTKGDRAQENNKDNIASMPVPSAGEFLRMMI